MGEGKAEGVTHSQKNRYIGGKRKAMTIELTDNLLQGTGLSAQDIILRLAILLFEEEKLTLGQASKLAGLHQIQFQRELATREIPIHYGIEEFEADMKTLENMP